MVRGSTSSATSDVLQDGATMRWLRDTPALIARESVALRFVVSTPDGAPAALEPYMGMAGHAVVVRNDGSVFIHLHPLGTISMAAQMSFIMREPADSVTGRLARRLGSDSAGAMEQHGAMAIAAPSADTISFPYAFPEPGTYDVWVQVKRGGRVLTGAFTATVIARP
jgi:hypothetical protein